MQTLRIKNEEVLVFYDSGSNGHLIEGQTAKLLNLDVLSRESVPIGGLGGKVSWADYGKYTIILGPDAYVQHVNAGSSLEPQGHDRSTHAKPR